MASKRFQALNALLLFFLMSTGCKAQTASSASPSSGPLTPDVVRRIQVEIRSRFNVPSQVSIAVSEPKPSETATGYDTIVITLSGESRSTTHDFLISKDRKTLARLEKYDVSVDIMSKIDVKGRPVRGNPNAKVTIVNYDDFQCPFCSRMHTTLFPGILQQYGSKVRFIYKDFPLVEIHPWAMHAAVDANCLAEQNGDAYWNFADYLHQKPKEIAGQNPAEAFANLDKLAEAQADQHHLDAARLKACLAKNDEAGVRASMAEGEKLGVDSTPTMFINGEKFSGAIPEAEMHSLIDRALIDAGEKTVVPPGAKR